MTNFQTKFHIPSLFSLLFSFIYSTTPSFAQTAPRTPIINTIDDIPVEGPSERARSAPEERRNITRLGIKIGGNFAAFKAPQATTVSGFGGEGALAYSSELAFQPISLEVELGYRLYFATVSTVTTHIIPLRFATLYRMRTGKTSLWKIGLAPALEGRITQETGFRSNYGIAPSMTFVSQWEWGGFLIEPNFTLNNLGSDTHYYSAAFRTGFRF